MNEESFQLHLHQLLQAANKQEFIGCFRVKLDHESKRWSYDLFAPTYGCNSSKVAFQSRFEKECEPLIEQAFHEMLKNPYN